MRITAGCLSLLLGAMTLFAQQGPFGRGGGMMMARTDEVQAFLGLSDQQVKDLNAVRSTFRDAARPLMQQIGEKMKALRDAREQDPNSATVTQLKADLADLQKQEQTLRSQYRSQAQAILTGQQKSKLAALQQALELMPVARQAVGLNLLDAPQDFPGGPGGAWMGGPRPHGGLGPEVPPRP